MTCTCEPRYVILYRESERLLAEAFDQDHMKVEAWGQMHDRDCPEHPEFGREDFRIPWAV